MKRNLVKILMTAVTFAMDGYARAAETVGGGRLLRIVRDPNDLFLELVPVPGEQ
jgi:hypothetical protein